MIEEKLGRDINKSQEKIQGLDKLNIFLMRKSEFHSKDFSEDSL